MYQLLIVANLEVNNKKFIYQMNQLLIK